MDYIARKYREAFGGLSREVWFLALTLLINRCGSMVLAFLPLYLTEVRGVDAQWAGIALGVYGVGSIFGSYLGGRLTEVYGPIRVQTVCLLLSGPGYVLIPYCNSLSQILLVLFSLSLVTEAVRPANATAVAFFTKPDLLMRAFALQRLAVNLGMSIGPAVGGLLAEYHFDLLFWVDGSTTFFGALAFLFFFRMKKVEDPNRLKTKEDETKVQKFPSPLLDWQFATMIGLLLVTGICFFQFTVTYPLYLSEHYHLKKWLIGLVFIVNTVVIVIAEMLLVEYVKKWNALKVIGWGCLLSCVGFGILPFGVNWAFSFALTFVIFSMLVLTIGEMLAMPIAAGWVAHRSSGKNQSVYMGWYTMTYSLACVIGPVAGTWLYEINPHSVWYCSLALGFFVLIGFRIFVKRTVVEGESEPVLAAD